MSEATPTAASPTIRPRRSGPNRMMVEWGPANTGKTTLATSLVATPEDTRWRYLSHIDGDDSASSIMGLFADSAVARHYPVNLGIAEFRAAILDRIPDIASGACGALVVEGLGPLYKHYVGEMFGSHPDDAMAGGNTTRLLYAPAANMVAGVRSAITRAFQAAPLNSGFACIVTMHAKNIGSIGQPDVLVPMLSAGPWKDLYSMTPIVVELSRLGDGPPRIEWDDPTNKIRRCKNAVARAKLQQHRDTGKPISTLPAFFDIMNGAEAHQRKTQIARETAARAPKPAPPTASPDAPQPAAAGV
jgi:hypothetical protein